MAGVVLRRIVALTFLLPIVLTLGQLAGCGSAPPAAAPTGAAPAEPPGQPQDEAPVAPFANARGDILGRNDRLLIYRPRAGDLLPAIAKRFLGHAELAWTLAEANGLAAPQAGKPLLVPLVPINAIGVDADRYQTVPILCYHRFGPGVSKMIMPAANFAAQLEWLSKNDYRVVTLADVAQFLDGRKALPKRSVVITIDDGYESVYRHAFPLLKRYGFAATLFVYTDFVGVGDGLSWAQLQEMADSGLVDIQSHSKTHRNLIERTAQESEPRYRQNIDTEIRVPRELIEKRLPAARVAHIAYPFGDANELVLETAARHRFEIGVSVNPGGNGFFAQPLMLRRTMIFGDLDLEAFKAKLQVTKAFVAP